MDYSILINSCDAYRDVWPMFFHILNETWKTERPEIYLNTESADVGNKEFEINVIKCKKIGASWGERLLNCLEQIDSEYILMMLEDFYFEQPIRTEMVNSCVMYLKENSNIICFQMVPSGEVLSGNSGGNEEYTGFIARKQFGMYKIIAGPTLWRKTDLIKLTKKKDSPWEWEYFGSFRTWLYGKDVYCWKDMENPLFDYDIEHGGAVHRGKWVGYKVKQLEEKYKYKNAYGKRIIEEDWIKSDVKTSIQPIRKRIFNIIVNRTRPLGEVLFGIILRVKRKDKYKRISVIW